MPLFSRHSEPVAEPVEEVPPRRSSTLFGRNKNRDVSPVTTSTRHSHNTFHSAKSNSVSPPRKSGGLLHRRDEDPSIIAARERVANAEARERDADKALSHARAAVKEAREHIKRLDKEAAEEARLAKIKQEQAKNISKRGHGLGRHGI